MRLELGASRSVIGDVYVALLPCCLVGLNGRCILTPAQRPRQGSEGTGGGGTYSHPHVRLCGVWRHSGLPMQASHS